MNTTSSSNKREGTKGKEEDEEANEGKGVGEDADGDHEEKGAGEGPDEAAEDKRAEEGGLGGNAAGHDCLLSIGATLWVPEVGPVAAASSGRQEPKLDNSARCPAVRRTHLPCKKATMEMRVATSPLAMG